MLICARMICFSVLVCGSVVLIFVMVLVAFWWSFLVRYSLASERYVWGEMLLFCVCLIDFLSVLSALSVLFRAAARLAILICARWWCFDFVVVCSSILMASLYLPELAVA